MIYCWTPPKREKPVVEPVTIDGTDIMFVVYLGVTIGNNLQFTKQEIKPIKRWNNDTVVLSSLALSTVS